MNPAQTHLSTYSEAGPVTARAIAALAAESCLQAEKAYGSIYSAIQRGDLTETALHVGTLHGAARFVTHLSSAMLSPPEEEQRASFLWYTAAADTEAFAKQTLALAGLTDDIILIALMNSGTGTLTGSKELATLKATVAFSQAFSTQKLVSLIERVTQKLADEAQTRSQQPEHPILHRIYPIQLSAHLQLLKLLTTVHKNVSEEIALQGVSSTTSPS